MSEETAHSGPPRETQFKPGKSGNPKGRPKKKKPHQSSPFDIVFEQTMTVQHNGETVEMSPDEAIQHRIYQDAMNGSIPAIRKVLRWIKARSKYFEHRAKRPTQSVSSTRIEPTDPENANEVMQILDMAHYSTDELRVPDEAERLLLEPWVTQAALSRKGGPKYSTQDIDFINNCTRDSESLKWPRGIKNG